jgi:hypothetical protein
MLNIIHPDGLSVQVHNPFSPLFSEPSSPFDSSFYHLFILLLFFTSPPEPCDGSVLDSTFLLCSTNHITQLHLQNFYGGCVYLPTDIHPKDGTAVFTEMPEHLQEVLQLVPISWT